MRTRPAAALTALALAGTLCALGACSRTQQYRMDPTPELDTLSQRHDDIDNALTIMADTNFRNMNQDIGRVMLMERPSRLSPQRIPY